jgi:hypothetical protein
VNKLDGWSIVGVILVAAVNMYFQQEYDGGDEIVQCPYDKFHRCLRHRMTKHMWKCHRREYERDRNIRYFELKHKIEQQRSQQLRPVQQLPNSRSNYHNNRSNSHNNRSNSHNNRSNPNKFRGKGYNPLIKNNSSSKKNSSRCYNNCSSCYPKKRRNLGII